MLTASWDDACASDVRVADLMEKYEIPTVFYWPVEWHSLAYEKGYEPLTYLDALSVSSRHEVGSHTITHRHLTSLSEDEAREEIVTSKMMIGQLFQREITRFCPPRGYTTGGLTQATLQVYESQRLTKGPGLVHVHPNSGANDNKPWRKKLEEELNKGDVEIWGHSWELDRFNLWDELEGAIRGIRR